VSCNKDLYENEIKNDSKNVVINTVNLNTDNKIPFELVSFKKKMMKKEILAQQNRYVFDSINNFYIDEENVKHIQSENKETYTISIKKDNVDNIENILFNKKADGNFDVYLVKYPFTPEELKVLSTSQLGQKQVEYIPVEFDENGLMAHTE
jgi:hypothetical protein